MARSFTIGSVALFVTAGLATSALADDLTPPSWRGNPGTTVQHWDFSSGPSGFAPDALPLNNPYGTPIMSPSFGTSWLPSFGGRNDVWQIAGGSLQFDIPNTGVSTHQKELWLQVTFLANAANPAPLYAVASPSGLFTQTGSIITPLGNGWFHELSTWATPKCPPFERISIAPLTPGAVCIIDQVVVDTQCIPVPAPGVITLAACGGLIALRRRR